MKTLIISDIHGSIRAFFAPLIDAGIISTNYEKDETNFTIKYKYLKSENRVIYLGDLIDKNHKDDSYILNTMLDILDTYGNKNIEFLIGNHETYYLACSCVKEEYIEKISNIHPQLKLMLDKIYSKINKNLFIKLWENNKIKFHIPNFCNNVILSHTYWDSSDIEQLDNLTEEDYKRNTEIINITSPKPYKVEYDGYNLFKEEYFNKLMCQKTGNYIEDKFKSLSALQLMRYPNMISNRVPFNERLESLNYNHCNTYENKLFIIGHTKLGKIYLKKNIDINLKSNNLFKNIGNLLETEERIKQITAYKNIWHIDFGISSSDASLDGWINIVDNKIETAKYKSSGIIYKNYTEKITKYKFENINGIDYLNIIETKHSNESM